MLLLSDEPPGPRRYPLLVYFDGSGCSSATNAAAFLAQLKDKGYGFAAPEKRGVRPGDDGGRCTAEYLATNDRTLRVADGRAVLANARRLFPRWDGRLVLAGASDGAGIAATLAADSRETVALVYLAGVAHLAADLARRGQHLPPLGNVPVAGVPARPGEDRRAHFHGARHTGRVGAGRER